MFNFEEMSAGCYLNLYLTANGLKPACEVTLYIPDIRGYVFKSRADLIDARFKKYIRNIEQFPVDYKMDFVISPKSRLPHMTNGLLRQANYVELASQKILPISKNDTSDFIKSNISTINKYDCHILFFISNGEVILDDLRNAFYYPRDDSLLGKMFGYPEEAVNAYVDGVRKDAIFSNIEKAVEAKIPIPSWPAYLHFVIDKLDVINNDVSQSCKTLGEKYQAFVRKNNPELAFKVEAEYMTDYYVKKMIVLPTYGWNNKSTIMVRE